MAIQAAIELQENGIRITMEGQVRMAIEWWYNQHCNDSRMQGLVDKYFMN